MECRRDETFPLLNEQDVVRTRQLARSWAVAIGFSLVEQTKIVTAASELARNAVEYGGGLDDFDFAGDIEVIDPGAETALHHRGGRGREGAGAVNQGVQAGQVRGNGLGIVEGKDAKLAA